MSNGKTGRSVKGKKKHVTGQKFPPVLYGLEGIMSLFNVSKATASRYFNTFLKGKASTKNGNVIITDTREALVLFGVKEPENLIMYE